MVTPDDLASALTKLDVAGPHGGVPDVENLQAVSAKFLNKLESFGEIHEPQGKVLPKASSSNEILTGARAMVSAARIARRGLPVPSTDDLFGTRKAPDDGFIPHTKLDPFLSPDLSARYVASTSSTTGRYLDGVKSQVLAEYAGFLGSAFVERLEVVRFVDSDTDDDNIGALDDVDETLRYQGLRKRYDSETLQGSEFHNALAVYRGYVVLMEWDKKRQQLTLVKGDIWKGRRLPSLDSPWGINVFGYVGDYVNQYAAACAFAEGRLPTPTLLFAIADPTMRRPSRGFESREISANVPLNDRQGEVIRALSSNLEGIQGPPGTGKSTVIFHLVNSILPVNDVTLATCVQNKAVDAIAEKFAAVQKIPFVVLGNEERLGALARKWTLEEQTARDPRVIILSKVEKRLLDLHKCLARDAKKAELGDDDGLVDTIVQFANASAGACTIMTQELKSTQAAVRASIVANARVVLCTVATASRSLLIDYEFADVVGRITTAVLDEAGTCSEPNMPLLMLLPSIKRIIAIGDQKQLAPFSHMQSGSLPDGKKVCFAFQKGRCARGANCKFSHVKSSESDEPLGFFQRLEKALPQGSVAMLHDQYRMHPSIATCVSDNFYSGQLQTPRDVASERQRADSRGMYFLTYRDGYESKPERGTSTINLTECALCFKVVEKQKRAAKSVMVRCHILQSPGKGAQTVL